VSPPFDFGFVDEPAPPAPAEAEAEFDFGFVDEPTVAEEMLPEVDADVGEDFAYGQAQDYRERMLSGLEGRVGVAGESMAPGVPPPAEYDPEVAQAMQEVGESGLFGGWPVPELEGATDRPPGPPEQTAQPTMTTRDPTVLGTLIDVLEVPQRLLLSPFTAQEGESAWESFSRSLDFPTWQPGEKPRDAITLYRDLIKERGGDPDSWGQVVGGIAFSILTDPTTYLGVGAVRKAVTMVAAEQAAKIGRRSIAATGISGSVVNSQTAALNRHILDAIDEGGTLLASRSKVRDILESEVGDTAATKFDELGDAWGKVGLRAGVPVLQERLPFMQRELVSAKTLGRARAALPAVEWLRKPAKIFSPLHEKGFDAGWDGALEFYESERRLGDAPEHLQRVTQAQIAKIAKRLPKASAKEAARLIEMGTGELRQYVDNTEAVWSNARDFAEMTLNMPARAATERFRAGALGVEELLGSKATLEQENIFRAAYAKSVILGQKTGADSVETAEAFHDYVFKALKNDGFADDAAEHVAMQAWRRAKGLLPEDIGNYSYVRQKIPDQLKTLLRHHESEMKGWASKENGIIRRHAVEAARRAAAEAKRAGLGRDGIAAASKEAHGKAAAKMYDELENYFYHFIQDVSKVRRRDVAGAAAGAGAPGRHRQFLDVLDNWEHGQNPATDLMVSMAARAYQHVRFSAKEDATRLVFGDKRWARPIRSSKGLTKKAGWDELSHPFTGEKYAVREEVYDAMNRAMGFFDPETPTVITRFYDAMLSRWKGYATHGRPVFYNLRNMVDDGWRMWMGGFDMNPVTAYKATHLGMLGRLEVGAKVKDVVRGVRGDAAPGSLRANYRKHFDRVSDWYDDHLQKIAEKTLTNARGQKITMKEFYDEAVKRGIVEKGYVSADLAKDLPAGIENARTWDNAGMAWRAINPFSKENSLLGPQGFYLQGTGKAARFSENQRRMTLFLDQWEKGATFDAASNHVRKWLFDYKELTSTERRAFRRLMPFYTFTRKNIPAIYHSMIKHPGRFTGLGHTKRGVEAKAESEYGPVGVVRDYMDDLYAWRLPHKTNMGSPVFWNPGLSAADVNVFGAAVPGMRTSRGQDELWDRFTPAIDLYQIFAKGRDPRTGRSMRGRWAEPDPFLKAMVTVRNLGPRKIPVMSVDGPRGKYDVIPERIVRAYQKMLPNAVAYGRLFGRERADPFGDEQAVYRQIREVTGQSLLVNNPIKAEAEFARQMVAGPLAGVRPPEEGATLGPQ